MHLKYRNHTKNYESGDFYVSRIERMNSLSTTALLWILAASDISKVAEAQGMRAYEPPPQMFTSPYVMFGPDYGWADDTNRQTRFFHSPPVAHSQPGFTYKDGIGGSERERELKSSFSRIWNYTPMTKTTDIAAIDLDLKVIMELLSNSDFVRAAKVYKEGGHVGSTAVLTLIVALDRDIPAGQRALLQAGENDDTVFGTLYLNARRGDKILLIQYDTTVNQDDFVGCQVGALPDPKTSGCFVESGSIIFPDLQKRYRYTYRMLEENINLRSLLTLGLDTRNFVENDTFRKYLEYYKSPLYADEIITAAFVGRNFESNHGDMDFEIFENTDRKEIVETSIVLLTIWMTVVGSMEQSVSKCYLETCETGVCQEKPGVFDWDSAVAYYAGSSLVEPSSSIGNLFFYYADRHCEEMATCGTTGTEKQGNSFVNHEIFHWFIRGQRDLLERNCDGAQVAKNKIIELMTVPLVQGTIRYAHIVLGEMEDGEIKKHDAEAAGHALAVLPLVHYCNPDDAKIIYDNLEPNRISASFEMVKNALEKNYECMNVTCHQVGGIYDGSTNWYKEGAEPCYNITDGLTEEQNATIGGLTEEQNDAIGALAISGYVVLCVFVLLVGFCLFRHHRRKSVAQGEEQVGAINKEEEDPKEAGDYKAPAEESETSEVSESNINWDRAVIKTQEEVDEEIEVLKMGVTRTASC